MTRITLDLKLNVRILFNSDNSKQHLPCRPTRFLCRVKLQARLGSVISLNKSKYTYSSNYLLRKSSFLWFNRLNQVAKCVGSCLYRIRFQPKWGRLDRVDTQSRGDPKIMPRIQRIRANKSLKSRMVKNKRFERDTIDASPQMVGNR